MDAFKYSYLKNTNVFSYFSPLEAEMLNKHICVWVFIGLNSFNHFFPSRF